MNQDGNTVAGQEVPATPAAPENGQRQETTPAQPAAPAFDAGAFAREFAAGLTGAIGNVAAQQVQTEAANNETAGNRELPNIVPEAQRSAETRETQPSVGGQRDTDGPDGVYVQTHRMYKAIALKQGIQREKIQNHMLKAGMYNDAAFNKVMGQERAINLTSSEGLPFLPTTVDNRIEEIREQFGAMRQVCTIYNFSSGSHKVPNTSGRPKVFAVNEGSAIKTRKATWGSVTLDPVKWGLILPYSSEMNDEVGAQWVRKSSEQAGRAFAEMEDETVLIADGTAAYHSLDGIIAGLSGVTQYTMDTGKTTFNHWDYDAGVNAMLQGPAGNRDTSVHVVHPDMLLVMALFKGEDNAYLYNPNEEPQRLIRRVITTEAMPAIGDSAVSTNFHAFGDFSFVNIGIQRGVEVKLLDQATIIDTDDTTEIHLGATDSLALRFTARWDVKIGLPGAFVKSRTAAS